MDDTFKSSATVRETFDICNVNFAKHHYGYKEVEVIYHRKSWLHMTDDELKVVMATSTSTSNKATSNDNTFENEPNTPNNANKAKKHGNSKKINHFHPIQYVYYSESDQILRFNNFDTLQAIKV